MPTTLPIKLKKEPLIDAIFEVRFSSSASVSDILPGILYSKLGCEDKIERLPIANLPKAVRDADPKLEFAPLVRLHWEKFFIAIGERSLVISCKLPYPGWASFKQAILKILDIVKDIKIIKNVQRYSVKYIDLIPSNNLQEQVSMISASIVVGGHSVKKESFSLRIEILQEELIHIVSIITSAVAKIYDGTKKNGIVVDIDTIANVKDQDFRQWVKQLPDNLDKIHIANKEMFFKCLKSKTIDSLEPVYG